MEVDDGENIWLSPKVGEDPSANAMVREPAADHPPSLLRSQGVFL